ncbi:hypothetical protein MAPG_01436 [Magnaporthiopsis poae ATCC 64411]|uniref:Uncharacterized protein n=1 Tax=Magnaporthiopsis poae (strain ATCC 64411 / 73-15) TaxID=644358 RepID=A0A0C4DNP2_MAGP6|nr:hypothetical protein MAPG_01436 [Magnaporthiopsis poae ATCC 64411]
MSGWIIGCLGRWGPCAAILHENGRTAEMHKLQQKGTKKICGGWRDVRYLKEKPRSGTAWSRARTRQVKKTHRQETKKGWLEGSPSTSAHRRWPMQGGELFSLATNSKETLLVMSTAMQQVGRRRHSPSTPSSSGLLLLGPFPRCEMSAPFAIPQQTVPTPCPVPPPWCLGGVMAPSGPKAGCEMRPLPKVDVVCSLARR